MANHHAWSANLAALFGAVLACALADVEEDADDAAAQDDGAGELRDGSRACLQRPCESAADCPFEPAICDSGTCIFDACSDDDDCAAQGGGRCENHTCVCDGDDSCSDSYACASPT